MRNTRSWHYWHFCKTSYKHESIPVECIPEGGVLHSTPFIELPFHRSPPPFMAPLQLSRNPLFTAPAFMESTFTAPPSQNHLHSAPIQSTPFMEPSPPHPTPRLHHPHPTHPVNRMNHRQVKNITLTRLHSSRMGGAWSEGGGVPGPRGVSALGVPGLWEGALVPGGVCSGGAWSRGDGVVS